MSRPHDPTRAEAHPFANSRALQALAVLTGLGAACTAQPISGVGPEDSTPNTETSDAGLDAARGSIGDAGAADAGAADAGSGADSGSEIPRDAMADDAACIGDCSSTTSISTTQPIGLAVDETMIYWRTGAGNLMSASLTGAGVSTVFASPSDAGGSAVLVDSELNDLIVDATRGYFIVNAGSSSYVEAALLDGTGASTLDVDTNIADREQAIALDSTSVFVARYDIDPQGGSCPDLEIDVVPLTGGAPTTLRGACSLVRMAVDSSQNVYWTDRGHPPGTVNPSVMMQSLSAAKPTQIASAVRPYGIAVYGGNVYWSDAGNIMVWTIGEASASALSSSANPQDIVVDASGVYWVDSGSAVMMAPLGGGAAKVIAQGETNIVALATNSTRIFWADEGTPSDNYFDGVVRGVAK